MIGYTWRRINGCAIYFKREGEQFSARIIPDVGAVYDVQFPSPDALAIWYKRVLKQHRRAA